MKKIFSVLLTVLIFSLCFSFIACKESTSNSEKLSEYFDIPEFAFSKEEPSSAFDIKVLKDVKITKITGTVWWDYEKLTKPQQEIIGNNDSFTTTSLFTKSFTFEKSTPAHYNFEITPESNSKIKGTLKTDTEIYFRANIEFTTSDKPSDISFRVSNLKIEFKAI